MNKKIKYSTLFLSLFLLVGFLGLTFIAPYGILKPNRTNATKTPSNLGLESEHLVIQSAEGYKLDGYWVKSATKEVKGVIILIHGIGSSKEQFLNLAADFAMQGIETVMFDNRAHGASGGKYCTYGYYEKHDVSLIVNLIEDKAPEAKIGVLGNSLGGAIAIQALELDKRIEFGIIESTFTDLEQIVFDYKKRILQGLGIRSVSNYALHRAEEIADFDADEVMPINSVQEIEQPVLIVHGDQDPKISMDYGVQLFEKLKSGDKGFFAVKGGGHNRLFDNGGDNYRTLLMDFVDCNL